MHKLHATVGAILISIPCVAGISPRFASADGPISAAAPAASKPLDFLWLVRSWDLPEGEEASALALSADGGRIAVAGHQFVAMLDRENGKEIWRTPDSGEAIAAIHFSPDGKQLIIARGWTRSDQKGIALLDADTGKLTAEFAGEKYGTRDAIMSPDGKCILSHGGSDYSRAGEHADLWDAHSGKWISEPDADAGGKSHHAQAIAFFPDGAHYLCAVAGSVRMYESVSGKFVKQLDGTNSDAVAVSPRGDCAVLGGDREMVFWNMTENRPKTIVLNQRTTGAAFISETLCLTWGAEMRLWNAQTGEEVSWSGTYEADVALAATAGNHVVGVAGRHLYVWGLPGTVTEPADVKPLLGRVPGEGFRPAPPLVAASARGDLPRVIALLLRGADAKAMRGLTDRSGTTALHLAQNEAIARALLDAGADVNAVSSSDWNRRPLHFAVERAAVASERNRGELLKVVDLLLDKDANIEAAFGYDETPLQTAAKAANKELAAHLVARGAYYDIYSAAALGNADRILALLKAHPDLARERGKTTHRNALYWARSKAVIDVLLEAGAETGIVDAWQATPAKDLRGNGHGDLADYLERKIRK